MKIIYIAQYFNLPEEAGAGRHFASATELQKRGHQVTVITGSQNYRTGLIPDRYKGKLITGEQVAGVRVLRTYVYANYRGDDGKINVKKRLLNHLSFMLMAFVAGWQEKADLVLASSTPLFVGIPGWLLGLLKRIPFVFEIRDPWPEAVVALGVFKPESKIARLGQGLANFLYRQADCVVAVTNGFRKQIIQRGIEASKVEVVPHGVDLDIFDHIPKQEALKCQLGLENKFVAIYVGAFGMVNNLQVILKAARRLKAYPQIAFLLIGDGDEKPELLKTREEWKLENLIFLDPISKKTVPAYLGTADVCLLPLRDEPVFHGMVQNKTFDYLAAGSPVIACACGDTRQIIEASGAGVVVAPGDDRGLADAVLNYSRLSRQERERQGQTGRDYVLKNFMRKNIADKLNDILVRVKNEYQ
ncbi:MAG: glycosyltransferase family 4 protein [Candidatus Schekmanbacteria bacterium]|nr:glycosyltransferase family 4 protein [Candidatus Schekmanbacteria bacterium]